MSEAYTKIKDNFFSAPMPHFPDALMEKWQIAILFRRKYLNMPDMPVDDLYQMINNDMQKICDAWGYDDTLWNLLFEVYDDISRQIDPQHRDSRIRLLAKSMYEKHQQD